MNFTTDGNFETLLARIHSPALLAVAQHWHEARGPKRIPSWTDLLPYALSRHARLLWGLTYDSEAGEFTARLAGNRLRKWVSENFSGGRLEDLHSLANYAEAKQLLTILVTTPVAGRSSGRLFAVEDFVVTGERMVLPMAADGNICDGVLGVSDYAPPPLLGPVKLFHENIEWFEI